MKDAKIAAAVIAVVLLSAPLARAQGGNPPASTKESGQTSGHGMTAVEQASESGNVEQQIKALADQFFQAFGKADIDFMQKNFTDEFMAIHSDGKLSTKTQEIENIKSSFLKWDSVDVHDQKIHLYGDTGVVITLASSKGTLGGKPYSGDYRTTQVWVKQGGNWKLAAFQSTRVPTSQ